MRPHDRLVDTPWWLWCGWAGDRHLAAKPAPPTTMETIDWSQCGYFKGQDGQSELALCWCVSLEL